MKIPRYILSRLLAVGGSALLACQAASALPVIPGAAGFGTNTAAGRGGTVLRVTSLADQRSNPPEGTLRWACHQSGLRTIIFDVSGIIELAGDLVVANGNVTIAGQTAPAPGIMLKNGALHVGASDVLVQHIAIRTGNLEAPGLAGLGNRDSLKIGINARPVARVVIDHVSTSWAVDEVVSLWADNNTVRDVTLQNCFFAEALRFAGHPNEGPNGVSAGVLVGRNTERVSIGRSIMAHNAWRNPLVRDTVNHVNVIDNLVYRPKWNEKANFMTNNMSQNWTIEGSVQGHVVIMDVDETSADNPWAAKAFAEKSGDVIGLFVSDNWLYNPNTGNGSPYWRPEAGEEPWDLVTLSGSGTKTNHLTEQSIFTTATSASNLPVPKLSGGREAIQAHVMANAGARPAARDAVDLRIITQIQNGTGGLIDHPSQVGGWPAWTEFIRSPGIALPENPNGDDDGDGYTNLEEWLHQMAAAVESATDRPPFAHAGPDQTVIVHGDLTAAVVLDGSASFDFDGGALGYLWTWTGGSATGVSPTVILPVGQTVVTLTVTDESGETGVDTVSIEVVDQPHLIALSHLKFIYNGEPKPATVTTYPEGLSHAVLYDGSPVPPTLPGSYIVTATITNPAYPGTPTDPKSLTGTLTIAATALVRRGPTLNGTVDGSVQVNLAENITLNGNAAVSGDLLVPGTPAIHLNGSPVYGGTLEGPGNPAPFNHQITLNGGAHLGHVVRRIDPQPWTNVAAPPAPSGTRNVIINNASQSPGDFTTLRNLTLNGNAGSVAVPPGAYGMFTANGNSGFEFGVVGGETPAAYTLEGLTLNGNTRLDIVGPVVLTLGGGTVVNGGAIGNAAQPEWLELRLASGGATLNGSAAIHGTVVAPAGSVMINGNAQLVGNVVADRLTLNGNGFLFDISDRLDPAVALTSPAAGAEVSGTIALTAEASDDVELAGVRFTVNGEAIGVEDTIPPFSQTWNTLTVADGVHTLGAIARDTAGNTAASAPVAVTVGNVIIEDFEDGLAQGWIPLVQPIWTVVNEGGNHIYQQTNTVAGATALLDLQDLTDCTVEVKARLDVAATPIALMAVLARHRDPLNYYVFQFNSNGTVTIKKRIGSPVVQLGVAEPVPFSIGVWYNMKFEVIGDQLNGYIDDQLVISRTDTSHAHGGVGINTVRAGASFDDIVITPLPPSSD